MNAEHAKPRDALTEEKRVKCRHDPFEDLNHLIVESHWMAGVRIRCRKCGKTASVEKRGRVEPVPVLHGPQCPCATCEAKRASMTL